MTNNLYPYLEDKEFLDQLYQSKKRESYVKIVLLDYQERPIREIQGVATSGSISVSGSSAVRRTLNLSMFSESASNNLEDVDNFISVNKKIKLEIGLKNPISNSLYEDIIWFPLGIYILSTANISQGINGCNISITGKDKMCKLDGTVGGTFLAPLKDLNRLYENQNNEEENILSYQDIPIYQIIFELVTHFGEEDAQNIYIDIPESAKVILKYIGSNPIYFDDNYETISFTGGKHKYITNQNVGYQITEFIWPTGEELSAAAGNTVASILDKIAKKLGNFEYFYDVFGKFHFQEIKNYKNTNSPLEGVSKENYFQIYGKENIVLSLTSAEFITQINSNPKYDNIKNDFVVWGTKTVADGTSTGIRYHVAIDEKPELDLAIKMWEDLGLSNIPWQEELYLRAEINKRDGITDAFYDAELLAEWRKIYNPLEEEWDNGWNPIVKEDPAKLDYWLDFIDLPKYSVKAIGRRTKAEVNDKITSLWEPNIPPILIYFEEEELPIEEGYVSFHVNQGNKELFDLSSSGATALDNIRQLIRQHLSYNTTISITCLPMYHLEANQLAYIKNKKSGIDGNYQITQFTIPLAYNGTMTISATEVLTQY